ncbi:MAG: nuclear transport factor 2 family protein [Proteobacteria bacterium]|nr:nuclear transport factor 2 family protein [Pseudomonadota bacterium]
MGIEDRKAVVRAYVEAFNAGDFEAIRPLFTPDAEIYGVTGSGSFDVALPIWNALHDGLAMTLEIVAMAAEGDTVAVRFVERGAWVGPFMGRTGHTGKTYELTAMEWFQFEGDKVRRRWGARDSATIARQVGMTL